MIKLTIQLKKKKRKLSRKIQKNIKAIHSKMENEINKANDLFRIYRYNFLEKPLQMAVNEEDQIDNKNERNWSFNKTCLLK